MKIANNLFNKERILGVTHSKKFRRGRDMFMDRQDKMRCSSCLEKVNHVIGGHYCKLSKVQRFRTWFRTKFYPEHWFNFVDGFITNPEHPWYGKGSDIKKKNHDLFQCRRQELISKIRRHES